MKLNIVSLSFCRRSQVYLQTVDEKTQNSQDIKWQLHWALKFVFSSFLGKTDGNFHVIVLNEDVEKAYKDLRDFILQELEKQRAEGVYVSLKRATDK